MNWFPFFGNVRHGFVRGLAAGLVMVSVVGRAQTIDAAVFNWAQISLWRVERVPVSDGGAPFCRASARAVSPGALNVTAEIAFEVKENEQATLVFGKPVAFPDWMGRLPGPHAGTHRFVNNHFRFDDRPEWPMEYVIDYGSMINRYDLGRDPDFFDELATSRTLSFSTKSDGAKGPAASGKDDVSLSGILALADTAPLSRQLRECLVSLHQTQASGVGFVRVPFPDGWPKPQPIVRRLEIAREKCRQTQDADIMAQADALLARGLAAAAALRLGEADQALAALRGLVDQGCPLTPSIRRGLEQYFTVLLLGERLDEAAALARSLSHNEAMLAAVAVARGDYDGGRLLVCAAASRMLGLPIADWRALSGVNLEKIPVGLSGGVCSGMRQMFLWWAMAAFGQEQALVRPRCANCVFPASLPVPTTVAANAVGNWIETPYMREGAADAQGVRTDLGLAVFWRGASLLRAGYLQAVGIDFDAAAYELQGQTGQDGWIDRVELLRQELFAAREGPRKPLAAVRKLVASMAVTIGEESLPWLEAKALESELAARLGENGEAEEAARRGGEVAVAILPAGHSLLFRLRRDLCQALLADKRFPEALEVAGRALGRYPLPSIADDQMRALLERVATMSDPSPGQAERSDVSPEAAKTLREGRILRARQDLLADAIGLPPMSGNMSVAARFERIKFMGPLARLSREVESSGEGNAVRLLRWALVFDEMRADSRLRGSFVGGGDRYADKLVDVARGNRLGDEEVSAKQGMRSESVAQTLFELYGSALDWNSLGSMFPGEKRQYLLPGEASSGLEIVMDRLYAVYAASSGSAAGQWIQQALAHVQAASRGDVLANMLTRTLLVANPGLEATSRRKAQLAINGELWLRRQRGALLELLHQTKEASSWKMATFWVDGSRALIRQQSIARAYYELQVSNTFFSHILGATGPANSKLTMNWRGTSLYECSIDQMQRRLTPDAAAIVWLPLRSVTHIFVITKDGCFWIRSPWGQSAIGNWVQMIETYAATVSKWFEDQKAPVAVSYPFDAALALYKALLDPVATYLKGVTHLYTVQLGAVGSIPLGLLVTQPWAQGQEPRWLADRFALTRMPALANPALFDASGASRREHVEPLFAAGNPVIGAPGNTPNTKSDIASLRTIRDLDKMAPLPESGEEMTEVANSLGLDPTQKARCVLSDARATPRGTMDRLRQGRFKYLLFATHALANLASVGEPALVLSAESGPRRLGDDGLLRASDIVGMNLDADMVILSACQTSPSGEEGAEPIAGLASAFLVAGAHSVLSTRWSVVSDASRLVSTEMIAFLQRGEDPAKALQLAQKQLRAQSTSRGIEHLPPYWAAYELIGFPHPR